MPIIFLVRPTAHGTNDCYHHIINILHWKNVVFIRDYQF